MAMPTRSQVRDLLDGGHTYETAGPALGICPGLAYMIATGRPADGSDGVTPDESGTLTGSPQRLVGPQVQHPPRNETVLAWVRQRAARELTR